MVYSETRLLSASGQFDAVLNWAGRAFDERGRHILTRDETGIVAEYRYNDCCNRVEWEKDRNGGVTMYKYDVLNRVTSQIERAPGLAARTTWFEYDALGNTIKTTVQAGDLIQTTSSVYNLMGDLVSTTDAAGLTTRYEKDLKNRRTTTTLPNGAVRIEDTCLDGHLRAVQGDAVIAEFYDYGVDKKDGHRWTLTKVAKPDGPRWSRSRVNALGQNIQSERPSPVEGYTLVSALGYDEQGRLLYSGQAWSKNPQAGGTDGSPKAPTGRNMPAQGNALGTKDKNNASPEGAGQQGTPAQCTLFIFICFSSITRWRRACRNGNRAMMEDMKAIYFFPLAAVLAVASLAEDDPPFRPLFNGKNLDGWVNVNCGPETWTVGEDGLLVCTGKPIGELRTDRMYQNFILELEWRHLKPKGNAGVFVWADDLPALGQPFIRGIEIQVLENAYGQTKSYTTHGDIFPIHGARMTPENGRGGSRAFPTEERSKPSPEWNHYRIECRDGSVSLAVNGKVVTRGSNASPKKGYICLESEGGVVNYRDIKIAELPDTPVAAEDIAIADRGYRSLYTGTDFSGWRAEPGWFSRDWLIRHEGETESVLETEESFGGDVAFLIDFNPGKNFQGAAIEILGLVVPITPPTAGRPGSFSRFEGSIREGKAVITQNGQIIEPGAAPVSGSSPLRLKCRGEAEWANVFIRAPRN